MDQQELKTEGRTHTIAVDAMGADLGVAEVIRGVRLALNEVPDIGQLILVGKERWLKSLLKVAGLAEDSRLSIHPASQVIGMDEKPIESLKNKKDASMIRAIELMRDGHCNAVVSSGNTGSLMACGALRLRKMPGVERPAIATVMPTQHQAFILIDAGANPSAKAEHLVHNAILGSHYARVVLQKPEPRVGLLSIGVEEGKGTPTVLEAHEMLKGLDHLIEYNGLVEGFELFQNSVDVVVCDGFTGNILLKTAESIFHLLKDYLKDEIKKSPVRMAGAFLSQNAYKAMNKQLNPEQFGGAPLLGLHGNLLKAHGSSNATSIMNAIRQASEIIKQDMYHQSALDIEKANAVCTAPESASSSGQGLE